MHVSILRVGWTVCPSKRKSSTETARRKPTRGQTIHDTPKQPPLLSGYCKPQPRRRTWAKASATASAFISVAFCFAAASFLNSWDTWLRIKSTQAFGISAPSSNSIGGNWHPELTSWLVLLFSTPSQTKCLKTSCQESAQRPSLLSCGFPHTGIPFLFLVNLRIHSYLSVHSNRCIGLPYHPTGPTGVQTVQQALTGLVFRMQHVFDGSRLTKWCSLWDLHFHLSKVIQIPPVDCYFLRFCAFLHSLSWDPGMTVVGLM